MLFRQDQASLCFVWLPLVAVVVLLIASTAGGPGAAAVSVQPRWVMRDLGTWLGGKQSWAVAVNERGQVVVVSETAQTVVVGGKRLPVTRALLWENGTLRDLGVGFGGPGSWAAAINDHGQVVGQGDTKAVAKSGHHVTHAFLWENGKVRDLGALAAGESSYAVAVNERGQVVGASCRDVGRVCRAFLWQGGKMTDLGTLGGAYVEPVDVNERGQIVGTATTGVLGTNRSPIRRAFVWQNGKLRDLGTLGGPRSWVSALNDRGQIVGTANIEAKAKSGWMSGAYIEHAFLWQNGKMRDLGTLGGEWSNAVAINGHGQVIGGAQTGTASRPVIWRNGRMRALGRPLEAVSAINERGQVVGWSFTGAKRNKGRVSIRQAFLWENGKLTDLGTLGGTSEAVALNERDEIIGSSEPKAGVMHAVLWTRQSGN